jgi:hypothetical protein
VLLFVSRRLHAGWPAFRLLLLLPLLVPQRPAVAAICSTTNLSEP